MRKFNTGDFAIYRNERVIICRNRKTNDARQTWYYVKPANKRSALVGTYVRSDGLETV